jgi:hypothetical protein
MRPRISLALALIAGLVLPALCAAAPPAQRVNAHELVRMAAGSCSSAVQALTKPGGDPALRSALEAMAGHIAEVGAHLDARDLGFFKALRSGSRRLAEVQLLVSRNGLQDAGVRSDLQSLEDSYGRLRNRYGQEWLRFRTGRPLNADEERRFAALRAMQARLAGALAPLQTTARRTGDAATAGELALLITQANSIAQAPSNLDEMLNASVLGDSIQGEYAAVRDANPEDAPEWNAADEVVENLSTDESVGFVFTTDLKTVQQWSYTEEPTDLPPATATAEDLDEPDPLAEALEDAEPEPETGDVQVLVLPLDDDTEVEKKPEAAAPAPAAVPVAVPVQPVLRCFLL